MKQVPIRGAVAVLFTTIAFAAPGLAQEQETKEPRRTRIGLGAQLVPSFPGADSVAVRPLVSVSRARGDSLFKFGAPDESFGFPVVRRGNFAFGPAIGVEGSRTAKDVGANLPKVGFTIEAGAFAQYSISESFRVRAEVRKGLGGHKGLVSNISADFVAREGDKWLFSVGPRATIADRKYQRAYFAVAPEDSLGSGLAAYSARGGIQSAGAAAGYIRQLSSRWGLYSYAKYDWLIGDAADSPIVINFGSRDQFSGGLAATYTFGGSR